RRDERHSIRWTLPGRTTYLPRPPATLAAPSKGWATRCTVLGFTANLAAVLRTLMPPARAVLIRSASLSAIGGRPSRLPSRLARCRPARTRSLILEGPTPANPPTTR